MKLLVKQNSTSVLATVFFQDSSSTTGAGLGSIVYNSSGISAYYFKEGAASATPISLAPMTIGTWATGGLILIDGTHAPGLVQLGLPNAMFTSLGSVAVYIFGVTNMAPLVLEIQVVAFDPADSVRLGLTALPNATAGATNGLPLSVDSSGRVDVLKINGASQTARDIGASVLLSSGTGTGQVLLSSGTVTVGTNNDKTGYSLTVTPPTAATIASTVWQNTTAGDFTVASSIGKSILNGVSLGTGLTINGYTGNTPQTGDAYARIGSAGAGLTAITGVTLAASQPGVTIPTVTTVGTTTNLTNAATAGDFTATMKASIGTAVAASAVASVTAPVAITSNIKQNQALANFRFVMTDSTTHAPKTGLTVTVTRGIDGGAQAAGTLSSVTEIGNGEYRVDFAAADLNGKDIVLRATAAGADDLFERIVTQP